MTGLTKASLDAAILSIYSGSSKPTVMLISDHAKRVLDIMVEADQDRWDRRRRKRELRRLRRPSQRKPYHKAKTFHEAKNDSNAAPS